LSPGSSFGLFGLAAHVNLISSSVAPTTSVVRTKY
jgi:hypothetical protein